MLGPSGCERHDLRMIAVRSTPTLGTIEMTTGNPLLAPASAADRRQMSMISTKDAIWTNMTVEPNNVAFRTGCGKITSGRGQAPRGEMLEVVHRNPLADRYPSELAADRSSGVACPCNRDPASVLALDGPLPTWTRPCARMMRFEIGGCTPNFTVTTVYVTHVRPNAMVTSD